MLDIRKLIAWLEQIQLNTEKTNTVGQEWIAIFYAAFMNAIPCPDNFPAVVFLDFCYITLRNKI